MPLGGRKASWGISEDAQAKLRQTKPSSVKSNPGRLVSLASAREADGPNPAFRARAVSPDECETEEVVLCVAAAHLRDLIDHRFEILNDDLRLSSPPCNGGLNDGVPRSFPNGPPWGGLRFPSFLDGRLYTLRSLIGPDSGKNMSVMGRDKRAQGFAGERLRGLGDLGPKCVFHRMAWRGWR